ncbi:MAG: SUMF1/EgtB/PvdO family nonheme iron enzyme [Candidatus Electrothrix communis]|nr:MAG: SUMF1/EgtB/PvdO family nonheme iron enzyme [Candidatus Electrothrix communis]
MNDKNIANLGRNRLIRQLARRITRHFERGSRDALDKSLVIGIFGEWGSGKSWILEQLALRFEKKEHRLVTIKQADKEDQQALILPIRFNPWRFEAEEHLIVPLLMTTHNALMKQAAEDKGFGEKLSMGAGYFFKSSLAFASAWKFKIGLPGVGSCDFSPEAALKAQEALQEKLKKENELPPDLNSCYYDFENQLKEVTGQGLKLLFLIDDIDRCLPERAVQMLEAIKLFLDVPECVFVLGVDDEVVERGIRHRYRDYNNVAPTNEEQGNGDQHDLLPPITGAEYLEKIIHLPIRLPLMRKRQVAELLENRYPSLFKVEPKEEGELTGGRQLGRTDEAQELLKLFEYAVPMIPRKLIRAAELLEFLTELSESFQPDRVLLARLVLLQLFAPEVFRHLRRTNNFLLQVWAGWQQNSENKIFRTSDLKKVQLDEKTDEATWKAEDEPLIQKLLEAGRNRVNFDPCRVLQGLTPEAIPNSLKDYFHLVGEQENEPVSIAASVRGIESAPIIAERLETARLTDQQGFFTDLFSEREASWRKVLDFEELQGKILPSDIFDNILSRLNNEEIWRNDLLWLGSLATRLGWQQQDQLDKLCQWRNRLVEKIQDSRETMQQRRRYGLLLGNTGWLPEDLNRFVRITAGDFLYGEEKKTENIPADYCIGKYPVTNAQYKRFLDDHGYEHEELWSKKGWQWLHEQEEELVQPSYWGNKELANPLFPVVGVSWYEALAYCRWLDKQIRKQPDPFGLTAENLTKLQARLATEHEWERAARGTDGREFPWGKGEPDAVRLNTSASWDKEEKASTTPVIMFKDGVRKENEDSLWDMSGNIWEWTNSLDSDQDPHIRGGSWNGNPGNARCSIRYRNDPNGRNNNLGFRVVFSLAAC